MHKLTLTWTENGRVRTETIHDQQPSKNPGTVRIGRDPGRCDIVLSDPTLTVSGLHVEIFFHPQQHSFYLRSLRPSNPPIVDGNSIIQSDVPLRQGSTIYLGQMSLTVVGVYLETVGVPATIVMPLQPSRGISQPPVPVAQPSRGVSQPPTPVAQPLRGVSQPPVPVAQPSRGVSQPPVPVAQNYGLQCPRCSHVSSYTQLNIGCPWCGTSLAAAVSVLVASSGNF